VAKPPAKIDLGDYLPYLVNRVGTIIADQFGAEALAPHGLSIAMWRVMAVLASAGQQRQEEEGQPEAVDRAVHDRILLRICVYVNAIRYSRFGLWRGELAV